MGTTRDCISRKERKQVPLQRRLPFPYSRTLFIVLLSGGIQKPSLSLLLSSCLGRWKLFSTEYIMQPWVLAVQPQVRNKETQQAAAGTGFIHHCTMSRDGSGDSITVCLRGDFFFFFFNCLQFFQRLSCVA